MSAVSHGIGDVGQAIGHEASNVWHGITGLFNKATPTPSLVAPASTTANPALASTTALQTEIAREQNARSTATVLTSPSGLTDEPTTTSSLLSGA